MFPAPLVELGNDTVLCGGDSIMLNAGSGISYQYLWKTHPANTVVGSSQFLSVKTSGKYSVRVMNMYGVSVSDTIIINAFQPLTASAGSDFSMCKESGTKLSGAFSNNEYVLYWSTNGYGYFNHFDSVNPIYQSNWQDTLLPSLYFALHSFGYCQSEIHDTSFVSGFISSTAVNLGDDTILCENQNLILSPGKGFTSYLWQDNSTGNQFKVDSTTGTNIYWVMVENLSGCFSSDTIFVKMDTCLNINPNLINQEREMTLYPNPTKGKIHLRNQIEQGNYSIQIFSPVGAIVFEKRVYLNRNEVVSLDINNLSKGLYLVIIRNNSFSIKKKLIVQ